MNCSAGFLNVIPGSTAKLISTKPVSATGFRLHRSVTQYRDYWQEKENIYLGGTITYPGAPYEFGNMVWRMQGNAPLYGEHSREILTELSYTPEQINAMHEQEVVYVN